MDLAAQQTNADCPYRARKFARRNFLRLAASSVALPAFSRRGWAQAYPSRPVRIIVGFAPGGPADIIARLIGQRLAERLGQAFIIDNRPGAGSSIAAEAVAKAPPDGYTLLLITSAHAVNTSLYENLNFNFIRDIAPVAGIDREPLVMLVHPSLPAKPALTELLAGRVQVLFNPMAGAVEHIRAGTLRALAVTTATRSETLPGLPTVRDFLPGYEASVWFGMGAPRGTPAHIVEKLNSEINAGLADMTIRARLADWGGAPIAISAADFGKLIAGETEKWSNVVKFANIKSE